MAMVVFDWNATRVRCVRGPVVDYALTVPLEPPHAELPLVISLEKDAVIGLAALKRCRQTPQQICQGFLPFLSAESGQGPRWSADGFSLDARKACKVVWLKLHAVGKGAQGVVLTVPAYFQPVQAGALCNLGERAGMPVLGSAPSLLAAAAAGYSEHFWKDSVLVVDVDDYALTFGWVTAMSGRAHLIESRSFPHLGLRYWRDRLINTLADLFVWQHRRDPRDVPQAEQGLFDQLEVLIDATLQDRAIQLGVQGRDWFKHLLVHPEETRQFCQPLVNKTVAEADHLLLSCPAGAAPRGILLTHAAGRLPGLLEALAVQFQPDGSARRRPPQQKSEKLADGQEDAALGGVLVLSPEAPARAAHGLAKLFSEGTLPGGHLETILPLTPAPAADVGPPRLHYRGRDYLLRETSFMVGAQFGCQLWFDGNEHPEVSAQHCEIVFDHGAYTLYSRGQEPTLVNDRIVTGSVVLQAGDGIRLSSRGPMIRFFGKVSPRQVHVTFA